MTHEALEWARSFVRRAVAYSFTENESRALARFVTNTNRHTFFVRGVLPSNILTTLGAMYSRLKNPRGVRGVFVDSFLPNILTPESESDDPEVFLRKNRIRTLDQFINHSTETRDAFAAFLANTRVDGEYLCRLSESKRPKRFLETWLDAYGHNSIGRVGYVAFCTENISVMAAKSIEWTRPGAGFIELSTRFVDMRAKAVLPVWELLKVPIGRRVKQLVGNCFEQYSHLMGGEKLDGPFPQFLRETHGQYLVAAGHPDKVIETGVTGETYDVLGNLLPACTLTSVFTAVSGEAFGSVLKHLILDESAENAALVELLIEEAKKVGADQFARHFQPTEYEKISWQYLQATEEFSGKMKALHTPRDEEIQAVESVLRLQEHKDDGSRRYFDKLPRAYEIISVSFTGTMSFRGWRDLQRQGLSTHIRTLLTPDLGFYRYDKPAPRELGEAFNLIARESKEVYAALGAAGATKMLNQYILPMGWLVGFIFGCNLRQFEFCSWQRTKPGVNHEVRQKFLQMERLVRDSHPWWETVSRADMTPAYIFARGSAEKLVP